MKKTAALLALSVLPLNAQLAAAGEGFTHLQNTQHVVGSECTIFVNTKTEFPMGTELSAFGGAGSDDKLDNLATIAGLLKDRGYRVVADEREAEYKLELANGIQCVMTDGNPGPISQWMLDNFDTTITASGRFSGKAADGSFFENTGKREFVGFDKVSKFRGLVGAIVSYCRKG